MRSTPLLRSAAKLKHKAIHKRKRSSIGISSLSKSRVSTPKSSKKAKIDISNRAKPLMGKNLKKKKVNSTEHTTIVLDETDEGIIVDASTKSENVDSPDVEILTVKITPNGTKNIKASKKSKKYNPQTIFSKFNLPNPVFPKDTNYIPLNDGEEKNVKRKPNKSKGYKFDPNAKPNTNFTSLVQENSGKVYQFGGPSTSKGSCGTQR